ncbi:DUF975 family protein [Lutispora thermophila]|uniref:Uncharacterized membrane protein n=1 Tax=Lutispora thermophila DSM 19022 TaxID=1122184 RepID=A0A1M6E420_9FIRM|nr:DUF975 family protein [Lutispora thermophila]SHI80129.1 Uncharacterized membrane protein [Lutispora thermophila DSM 19022]
MWTRKELKDRAKAVLRNNYWKAFLISLVILLAGMDGGDLEVRKKLEGYTTTINFLPFDVTFAHLAIFSSISIFILLFLTVLRIFLGYSLEVGGRRFFVKSALYEDSSGCFKYAFDGENYMGIVKTMLLRGVQNFLWYLLFIIPGIVKSYAYSMVPYILAENPNIGAREAINMSIEMTNGHKLDMFILDLSFLGWYLLGALLLGVGTLFVLPYDNATKAELYLVLSGKKMCEIMEEQPY